MQFPKKTVIGNSVGHALHFNWNKRMIGQIISNKYLNKKKDKLMNIHEY